MSWRHECPKCGYKEPPRTYVRKRKPFDKKLAIHLYDVGKLSCRQIAAKMGVTYTNAHLHLNQMGVKLRPRGGSRKQPLRRNEHGRFVRQEGAVNDKA
jgi:hypothetical protein